ncbi:TIGR01897 family CRISPR-associated protein [Thermococcus indicus]|uniref:TIGR01897 family CRISPR-associated protein n=1 Tax=Thermococcus indicus TaxID=2586643 RepID=A0A4Y5SKG2_9EURY|nr:CRISPR-associated CARF protein Csx1 [Thermococcus indicus]QDA31336.1 TIGR01897 family CRISPR-associated protein [Thermococcus indicus]
MKLLVVSWGDFERWTEIKYCFGEEESVGPSTLPILQKVIKPDWTVILLSDTLGRDFSSLEALREDVRGRVMDFLDRIGAGREVDVIIVPGIGQFSHGTFRGNAMDAYHYLLHKLAEIIPPRGDLEVHFDSTHGLNYITLLAYRALEELLGIAAIVNEVKFTAYNSDPYVPKITHELTINVIEERKLTPSPLTEPLPEKSGEYLGNYSLPGREYGEVMKGLKRMENVRKSRGRLNAWISSVINGLPLVFASAFPEVDRLAGAIEELEAAYTEAIALSPGRVERRLSLGKGFGVLVKLHFQAKALETAGLPKDELSLEELLEVSERIFRGSVRASTKKELNKLSEALKFNSPSWIRLVELFEMAGKNPNRQVDDRNFLAHAGLEANLIELKREGELYVRYTREKVKYGGAMKEPWKVIENILSKTLGG